MIQAPAVKPEACSKHRVILVSSEQIYDNKWDFGQPVAEKCTFKCFCCNYSKEYTFKTK